MQYRRLGDSALLVSPVCLGTMTFGTPVGEKDSIDLVHTAMDLGINIIDTANMYEGYARSLGSAGGVAEEIVGKALKGRREKAVVVTKVATIVGPGPNDRGLSRVHVMQMLERSLAKMQTDYIDVYMIHWPDIFSTYCEAFGAIDLAVKQGKVRYAGVSNSSAARVCEALWTADRRNYDPIICNQMKYNILTRGVEEEVIRFCGDHGVSLMCYQPLDGGLLTGKYRKDAQREQGTRAADMPGWIARIDEEDMLDNLERVAQLADQAGKPMAQYTLSWILRHPEVATVVTGVTRPEQIAQNAAAAEWAFPAEDEARIDEIFPGPTKGFDPVRDPAIGG